MEDPWANAWGEPATTTKQPLPPVFPVQNVDDEEDITIPSWEAPVNWSDENSLWGARSPVLDKFPSWQSPYDDLPLGKPSPSPPVTLGAPENLSEPDEEPEEAAPEPEPEPELAPESPAEPPVEPPIPSEIPLSPPLSPPGSPDAFGTFETGLDDLASTVDAWSPSHASFAPESADSAWGAGWAPSGEDADEEDIDAPAAVDEWEAAKQQKAMQDKHVPPELLASILLQFTELANDLYPPLAKPTPDPDDYRASRHKGLQGIDSLNPTILRLLPTDLTLPPRRPFLKSAISKSTADALRLSRSAAFVRFSPLSHYGATKGSTAWEASVKRRPEAVGDADLLPPGWRVVEAKAKEEVVDKKKTGHGGLLSFFGRRAGTPPVVAGGEGAIPRSSSPASGSSPRASLDSVKSPTLSAKSPTNASATTSATPSTAVSPTISTSTPPPPPPPVVPAVAPPDAGADVEPTVPAAAPSAVSRFLGRFGRKAPAAGPQNLALSEGDFDFLADIEGAPSGPSLVPDADAHLPIMGALLDEPVPLPTKLAPPPRSAVPVPVAAPQNNGVKPRPEIDHDADELAIFGAHTPPPPLKPSAPALVHRVSSIPTPAPKTMSPVDSDIDFSAWGFDEEEKSGGVARRDSEPVAAVGTVRPAARQPLNTRAATNLRGVVPPPRRAPTAIMSSGPSKPAVVPKLEATFGFPPPPRTQTQTPIAALPPPPGTKAPANLSLFDNLNDDEFSDFHAPPQIAPPNPSTNSLYDAGFSSSTSSERGLFSSTSSSSIPANLFDDFDDFMQASPVEPTTLRTPSPPRPPTKPAQPARIITPLPAPLSFASPPSATDDDTPLALIAQGSSNNSLRSKRAAASHQRALSLVESAAATSGVRWPAPSSPLPEALAPPPDASDPFSFGGSSMQSQQAAFLGQAPPALKAFPPPPPARALSPPAVSPVLARPPPGGAQKMAGRFPPPPVLPLGGAQNAPAPVLSPPSVPTPLSTSAAPGKSGGLSAQDLSFFEGL